MALFEDHLYNGVYPYLTPEQLTADNSRCPLARGQDPEDFAIVDAIQDASLAVYYLTGKQFNGTARTIVRPHSDCNECAPYKLTMGLWPVTAIVGIRENGVDQDPEDYHIDEWRYIVKNNGETFPRYDHWTALTGSIEDNATDGWVFEVEVEHGIPAPPLIRRATAALACSLLDEEDYQGCEDCGLPSKLTAVSRQGVSFTIEDFAEIMRVGSTGVYALDMAIKVFNPSHLQSPTWVWTPEIARGTRRNLASGVTTS
jgi:hypothetical protein